MPRCPHHLVGGVVAAGAVNVILQWHQIAVNRQDRFDWGELLACCAVGGAAALIPDMLEPASHPNHRNLFHSLAVAALVAWLISGNHTREYSAGTKALLLAGGLGWLSHILLDALTPRCVPLV